MRSQSKTIRTFSTLSMFALIIALAALSVSAVSAFVPNWGASVYAQPSTGMPTVGTMYGGGYGMYGARAANSYGYSGYGGFASPYARYGNTDFYGPHLTMNGAIPQQGWRVDDNSVRASYTGYGGYYYSQFTHQMQSQYTSPYMTNAIRARNYPNYDVVHSEWQ